MRLGYLLLVVGCAHEPPTPDHTAPPVSIDAAVAPSFSPTLDAVVARDPDCKRACDRYQTCLGARFTAAHHRECLEDCWNIHGYRKAPAFSARRFADCLEALSCQAIEQSMSMNEGPAGYCYTSALR